VSLDQLGVELQALLVPVVPSRRVPASYEGVGELRVQLDRLFRPPLNRITDERLGARSALTLPSAAQSASVIPSLG
jgi:hypothetical protein